MNQQVQSERESVDSQTSNQVKEATATCKDHDSVEEETLSSPLKWAAGPSAPCSLYKGTCTAHMNRSYYSPSGSCQVFVYDHQTMEWSTLPDCPQFSFALVMVGEHGLTAVGGLEQGMRNKPMNTLQTFMPSDSQTIANTETTDNYLIATRDLETEQVHIDPGKPTSSTFISNEHSNSWREYFPPMPTKRAHPSALYQDNVLVVAGGNTTWVPDFLTTVEVLNICSQQWSIASSLPKPINASTGAVCVSDEGDDCSLFFLGGWDRTGNTVFTCSLKRLLSSCVVRSAQDTIDFVLPQVSLCSCAWQTVAGVPHLESSCVAVENRLFAVGGKGWRGRPSEDIHMYDSTTNSWILVGALPTARSHVLVTWTGEEMAVVGGFLKGGHPVNYVEVATLDVEKLEDCCSSELTGANKLKEDDPDSVSPLIIEETNKPT